MAAIWRLLMLMMLAVMEVRSSRYWDIFPYVHWYYRYYAPRPPVQPQRYARLVDAAGRLRIGAVKAEQAPPQAKSGGTMTCYQCTSTKDAYVYNIAKVPKTVVYPYAPPGRRTKTIYVTKLKQSTERRSGWGECQNSFPHQVAGVSSIKEVACTGRCYVSLGENRVVSRGCMSPHRTLSRHAAGCYRLGRKKVCVCDGPRCNNKDPPSL